MTTESTNFRHEKLLEPQRRLRAELASRLIMIAALAGIMLYIYIKTPAPKGYFKGV